MSAAESGPDRRRHRDPRAPGHPDQRASAPTPRNPGHDSGRDLLTRLAKLHLALGGVADQLVHRPFMKPVREVFEKVQAEVALVEVDVIALRARIEALAVGYESDRDVCLEWLGDPSMHMDSSHPARLSWMADHLNRSAEDARRLLVGLAPDGPPEDLERRSHELLARAEESGPSSFS